MQKVDFYYFLCYATYAFSVPRCGRVKRASQRPSVTANAFGRAELYCFQYLSKIRRMMFTDIRV
ncbi:hypothetical protein FDI18_gp07 [Salmonella phage vB_SenS_AG11]|uniref:Uncharacterized protein n=1 Tax=Salmonella phage vB_SenS_AG11 TaxID=1211279 RepID=S4SGN2_9CAUD|nr:hypothetical protein FDI18_gp07 [Salmonella phage vB_SenS_AG11]AFO12407.1 hypothetical protein [Salmonella phage vB_SenS_AG11]